jgi:hypothetical protein
MKRECDRMKIALNPPKAPNPKDCRTTLMRCAGVFIRLAPPKTPLHSDDLLTLKALEISNDEKKLLKRCAYFLKVATGSKASDRRGRIELSGIIVRRDLSDKIRHAEYNFAEPVRPAITSILDHLGKFGERPSCAGRRPALEPPLIRIITALCLGPLAGCEK